MSDSRGDIWVSDTQGKGIWIDKSKIVSVDFGGSEVRHIIVEDKKYIVLRDVDVNIANIIFKHMHKLININENIVLCAMYQYDMYVHHFKEALEGVIGAIIAVNSLSNAPSNAPSDAPSDSSTRGRWTLIDAIASIAEPHSGDIDAINADIESTKSESESNVESKSKQPLVNDDGYSPAFEKKIRKSMKVSTKCNAIGVRLRCSIYLKRQDPVIPNIELVRCSMQVRFYGDGESKKSRLCNALVDISYIDNVAHVDDRYIYELVKAARADVGGLSTSQSLHKIHNTYKKLNRKMASSFVDVSSNPSNISIKLDKQHLVLLKSMVIEMAKYGIVIDYKMCKQLYKMTKSGYIKELAEAEMMPTSIHF